MKRVKRHMTRSSVIDCQRCGKSEFFGVAAEQGWNFEAKDGAIAFFLCPDCQTEAEFLEAQANGATLDYSVRDGLIHAHSKAVG